ncbi:5-dehydro-4-deoxyglucarate dehydratase [Oceanobacillus bengalensis]|uniref:Probable 5-dehydro-4-deoxyglucarate dehydratase n=1 Tax=Oceanobacillus bengalensis TaxID=1435466 RepID=A0A494YTT8_9BACI|nr:5-dehydro-4-deoxyglucarate dehydratase [Oceanobacillus bengalensis]RKQ13561.1 5-dehydro-4-deoxyglucarate dehydratase [Oceanobacillus bengalensis]
MNRVAPTGILGFPVTPFDNKGNIDELALSQNIQFQLDSGLEAIFVACGAGEYHAIDDSEYETVIEIAKAVVKGSVPLYTGVGGNLTEALSRAKISEKYEVDGYLIMPPYLVQGEQEGIYQYFNTIATSTDLNAIVYHRDNAVMSLETIEKLAETPQVVGFKDGHGSMEQNIEFTQRIGNKISWLNGMPMAEVTMQAYVPLGFNSYSSAISNYIPHVSRNFYDALLAGDKETVHELLEEVILPINRIRRQGKGYAISLIKAGMEIVGLPVNSRNVRAPITPIKQEHYEELEAILQKVAEKYPSNLTKSL